MFCIRRSVLTNELDIHFKSGEYVNTDVVIPSYQHLVKSMLQTSLCESFNESRGFITTTGHISETDEIV
jgi:hypothetical protein